MFNKLFAAAAALMAVTAVASEAGATNYTLYIHGRTSPQPQGWSYWSHESISGVNAVPVNYDGTAHIWDSNPTVVSYLNAYCTNGNSCYVVCHSAGCAQIGYAFATYGRAWSIPWVSAGGSAAGGSDMAGSVAGFFTGNNIDSDLGVGTMRAMYNHDSVGDLVWSYVYSHVGNDWSAATNWLFSGGNDTAVAVHSSGFYRGSGSYYSPSGGSGYGGTYWDWTTTRWVDDPNAVCVGSVFGWCTGGHSGRTGHCNASSGLCYEGTYGGVMAQAISYAAANAR